MPSTMEVQFVSLGYSTRFLPLITENLWNLKLTRKLPAWGLWPQGWNSKELAEASTKREACALIWYNAENLTNVLYRCNFQLNIFSFSCKYALLLHQCKQECFLQENKTQTNNQMCRFLFFSYIVVIRLQTKQYKQECWTRKEFNSELRKKREKQFSKLL